MLGFVTINYIVNNVHSGDELHTLDDDGDTFQDIRNAAHFQFPNHRIVSIAIFSENDEATDITYAQGSLREHIQQMEGPNGQEDGDAIIDVFMMPIGPNEECQVCGKVAKWMSPTTSILYCSHECAF